MILLDRKNKKLNKSRVNNKSEQDFVVIDESGKEMNRILELEEREKKAKSKAGKLEVEMVMKDLHHKRE